MIHFEPGQMIKLRLPGGVFTGTIVDFVEGSDNQWIIEVPEQGNPIKKFRNNDADEIPD